MPNDGIGGWPPEDTAGSAAGTAAGFAAAAIIFFDFSSMPNDGIGGWPPEDPAASGFAAAETATEGA